MSQDMQAVSANGSGWRNCCRGGPDGYVGTRGRTVTDVPRENNFFLIRKFTRSSEAACTANAQESLEDYFPDAIGARFPATEIKKGAPSLVLGAPI